MRGGSNEEFLPESGALKSPERTSGDQRNPECWSWNPWCFDSSPYFPAWIVPWQPTPRLRSTSPFPNTPLVTPSPTFLFFSDTVPPIQPSSLSLSTLEKDQTTFLLYRMRARSLARPPCRLRLQNSASPSFVPVQLFPRKQKKKKASRSLCLLLSSQCYYYRKTTIGLLWSEHDWRVRGISSKFNF